MQREREEAKGGVVGVNCRERGEGRGEGGREGEDGGGVGRGPRAATAGRCALEAIMEKGPGEDCRRRWRQAAGGKEGNRDLW